MDLLDSPVRAYAWGSTTAIPELLGVPASGDPQAELWFGAHPSAPARVRRGGRVRGLDDVVAADPGRELGAAAVRFGDRLPFLVKVLAVAAPLSLQAHPNSAQAIEGYAAEREAGRPEGDPDNNYADAGHKPEVVVALTPFEALSGVRPVADTLALVEAIDCAEFGTFADALRARPDADGVREVVTRLLTLPESDRKPLVDAVSTACAAAARRATGAGRAAGGLHPDGVASLSIVGHLGELYPGDVGVVVALLLDHVRLQPGEAVYVPAGVLHSYQSGMALEVMASSDNVLRGGLTPKHVDVAELLRIVDFTPAGAGRIPAGAVGAGRVDYATDVAEFALSAIRPGDGDDPVEVPGGVQILVCTQGTARLWVESGQTLTLTPGLGAYVPASDGPVTVSGDCVVWRTGVAV